jgi:CheY-like chemotaxis protein
MDVNMPEMDGYQTTAAIREREKGNGRRLPIIAITGLAMKGDRERVPSGWGWMPLCASPSGRRKLFAVVERCRYCLNVFVASDKLTVVKLLSVLKFQ